MSGSDLNSIQESLSNRVTECVTIDPETEIEPCITQDVPLGHGRAELSYPPHPDQVEPDDALVPSCCRGLARQPSSEPQDTQPSVLMSEIVCTTMSEAELQEIDFVTPVESEHFRNDQLSSERISGGSLHLTSRLHL